jgi:hypothetical protein
MSRSSTPTGPSWSQFGLWAVVGPLAVAGLLAAFTPLILLTVPITALMIFGLGHRFGFNASMVGVISGLGLAPLLVAFLNRGGPGSVCQVASGSTSCTDEWSPWPWVAAGAILVGMGVALYRYLATHE